MTTFVLAVDHRSSLRRWLSGLGAADADLEPQARRLKLLCVQALAAATPELAAGETPMLLLDEEFGVEAIPAARPPGRSDSALSSPPRRAGRASSASSTAAASPPPSTPSTLRRSRRSSATTRPPTPRRTPAPGPVCSSSRPTWPRAAARSCSSCSSPRRLSRQGPAGTSMWPSVRG